MWEHCSIAEKKKEVRQGKKHELSDDHARLNQRLTHSFGGEMKGNISKTITQTQKSTVFL